VTALTVSGVVKTLGGATVLRDVTLTVPEGTRLAVVGPSGSGKTTLLRLVAGFDRVDSGSIAIDDRVVSDATRYIAAHRRGVGYVAQDGALFPHLTARQNIRFGLPRGPERAHRVAEAVALAGLEPALLDRYPHELSGGQQQRVSLARALAPRPRVMLLDEPFSALDAGLRAQTRRAVVAALDRAAVTTVLVTHDQEEALTFGHTVAVMRAGLLEQMGSPADVFGTPVSLDVARFLGEAVVLPGHRIGEVFQTELGAVVIQHDRASGTQRNELILLRPNQIRVTDEGTAAAVTVSAVEPAGPVVNATVTTAAGRSLKVTIPMHRSGRISAGESLHLQVDGGGVVYDQDDGLLPDDPRTALLAPTSGRHEL
jgi:iron(III) transport system ATP-binding protein